MYILSLGTIIDDMSTMFGIETNIIPNIITFFALVVVNWVMLRGGSVAISIFVFVNLFVMGILSLLEIDSIFNIISIIESIITDSLDLINPF